MVTSCSIYLVHTAAAPDQVLADGLGDDLVELTDGLVVVESELTRSELYHGLKRLQAPDTPLLVAELTEPPKMKAMAPGAHAWLRDRFG